MKQSYIERTIYLKIPYNITIIAKRGNINKQNKHTIISSIPIIISKKALNNGII